MHNHTYICMYFLLWLFCNSKGGLVVQAQKASGVMIKSSRVRTTGDGAKLAGVPQKTGRAAAKNGSPRLYAEFIQEGLGRRKRKSTDMAKRASLYSLHD